MRINDGLLAGVITVTLALGGYTNTLSNDVEVLKYSKANSTSIYKALGTLEKSAGIQAEANKNIATLLGKMDDRLVNVERTVYRNND